MDEDTSQSLASILVPVFTIGLVVLVQMQFWFASSPETESTNVIDEPQPPTSAEQAEEEAEELDNGAKQQPNDMGKKSEVEDLATNKLDNSSITPTQDNDVNKNITTANDDEEEDLLFARSNQWRCVCEEGSFLPPALLKTFGPAEAMVRLGTGQCYHKQM